MKVLYYSIDYDKQDYGGVVIRKRNRLYLSEIAGEGNVSFFSRQIEFNGLAKIAYILQEITGFELHADRKLTESLKNADMAFIDGTDGGTFSRPALRKKRVVTFFHNVEYDYYRQLYASPRGLKSRLSYIVYKAATYFYEKRLCKYSDTVITLNERDSGRLKCLYGRGADLILPTSMPDTYSEGAVDKGEPFLLFVGSDFFGNTEGLFWFCDHCIDDIKAPLVVAGKGMERYKDKYPSDKIRFYGYVDDLSKLYRDAAAVVLPIISGSGMKTKTCEAMMHGKVIFGTKESFEGYSLSKDCILCNDEKEFVDKIDSYLDGNVRYFSADNRDLYLNTYETGVVAKRFYDHFTGERHDT